MRVGEIVVDDAYGVVGIDGRLEPAADSLDCPHVSWRDIATGADQSE